MIKGFLLINSQEN